MIDQKYIKKIEEKDFVECHITKGSRTSSFVLIKIH